MTKDIKKPHKHLRASDIRGLAQLATQATEGVTRVVEGVHASVLRTLGVPGGKDPGRTRGLTGLVYERVQEVIQHLGKGADTVLAWIQPLFESDEDHNTGSFQREAVLAALNGVMGDRLLESENVFAAQMTLRYQGESLNWQIPPEIPGATGKVLLLIHGLCMNDLQWQASHEGQEVDHGAAVASALGYTPIYLRYNSGLHTSQNGRELSAQLEHLVTHWPTKLQELAIIGHSMGGLVTRSALHYGKLEALDWPSYLKYCVFLGTPHHGAPLERAGNWVDVILGSTLYTAPFAKLGQLRSAGITDLRYGHVLDEDWQDQDRFQRRPDRRRAVPLPDDVACFAVAATTATKHSVLNDNLIGDGLTPLNSALGQHEDPHRNLAFNKTWIAYGMNHMELLSSPKVTGKIVDWIGPSGGSS